MGAKKTRTHVLTITVRFDKPVYHKEAVRAFNNSGFYGESYADSIWCEWEVLKLGKAK